MKTLDIVRQVASKEEAEAIEGVGKTTKNTSAFLAILYPIAMYLTKASASKLWGALNSQ